MRGSCAAHAVSWPGPLDHGHSTTSELTGEPLSRTWAPAGPLIVAGSAQAVSACPRIRLPDGDTSWPIFVKCLMRLGGHLLPIGDRWAGRPLAVSLIDYSEPVSGL